jgi:hypothetical protein
MKQSALRLLKVNRCGNATSVSLCGVVLLYCFIRIMYHPSEHMEKILLELSEIMISGTVAICLL